MDWSNENILKFLELYKKHPCIWDPNNRSHRNRTKINDAWIDIKNNMSEPCTVQELKKKRESLMSAYRWYRTKIKTSESSAENPLEIYQPKWFAYELMNSFLEPIYKCRKLMDIEDYHNYKVVVTTIKDDTSDTNAVDDKSSNSEEEYPIHILQGGSPNQGPSFNQTITETTAKRNCNNPELLEDKKQIKQTFNILERVAPSKNCDEEDECNIFGKLVATKIRKLSEDRRVLMMIKINQLFYDECFERKRRSGSSTVVT